MNRVPDPDWTPDELGRGPMLRGYQDRNGLTPGLPKPVERKLAPLSFYGTDPDFPEPTAPPASVRALAPAAREEASADWKAVLAALMEQAVRSVINDEVNSALEPFRKAFAELKTRGVQTREDLRKLEEAFARLELFVEDLGRTRRPAPGPRRSGVR